MIALYWLNLIFFVGIAAAPAFYFSRLLGLRLLNPLVIPVIATTPIVFVQAFSGSYFFLEGSLYNPFFQYAVLVNNVHALCLFVSLAFCTQLFLRRPAFARLVTRYAEAGTEARPGRMVLAGVLFLALFAVSFLLLTKDFGLLNWLANPRVGYQLHRTGAGQWYSLCITFLSVSLTLVTLYVRSNSLIPLIGGGYIAGSYFLGSKGLIIFYALYLVVVLAIRGYRYLKPLALIILAGALLLVGSILLTSLYDVTGQVATYADYYVNAAQYYRSYLAGEIPLFYGQIYLTNFWTVVPRGLYPDKPIVYGAVLISEYFQPGSAANTNTPVYATTEYFGDFGWLGTVLSGLLSPLTIFNGFLYALILPRLAALNRSGGGRHKRTLTYACFWLLAPNFMVLIDFPLNVLFFFAIAAMIDLINRVKVTKSLPALVSEV